MNMILSLLLILGASVFTTGCLKTRGDVRQTDQQYVVPSQNSSLNSRPKATAAADSSVRIAELEEQVRTLMGRVEESENALRNKNIQNQNESMQTQEQKSELEKKLVAYQEALVKMEAQLIQLNAEVQTLRAEKAESQRKNSFKSPFEEGQSYFDKKDWKAAILAFQKYRDENPKGKNFSEATYRIGVSFQELNMKDEAKTFFEEVVARSPNSDAARKAKVRLKSLK